jgi:hypothetical protein
MSQIREVPDVEDVVSNINYKEPQDGKSSGMDTSGKKLM